MPILIRLMNLNWHCRILKTTHKKSNHESYPFRQRRQHHHGGRGRQNRHRTHRHRTGQGGVHP
ncbi:hypothetical protein [Moraxella lacunata]|uniref:hypothetical protein n=1 Tax=Moraxella lacunata TaxID=477 RepID=UPI003EDEE217